MVEHGEEENREEDKVETISKVVEVFLERCLSVDESIDLESTANEYVHKRLKDENI